MTVKLNDDQIERIIKNVLDSMELIFVCLECNHEILFKKFGPVTCENCGQKWSLRILGEKIN